MSRDGSVLPENVLIVLSSFNSFLRCYPIITFLFACLKLVASFENTETLLRISFSLIGQCSPVAAPRWLQRKCFMEIQLSQPRRLSVQFLQAAFQGQNRCFSISEEGY